jgi:hypothetical protein
LRLYAGIHRTIFGSHRLLSKRFPYAIYYAKKLETVFVKAVWIAAETRGFTGKGWIEPFQTLCLGILVVKS